MTVKVCNVKLSLMSSLQNKMVHYPDHGFYENYVDFKLKN